MSIVSEVVEMNPNLAINLKEWFKEGSILLMFGQYDKPKPKTYSVDGIPFDHNHSQELPEQPGKIEEHFDLDSLEIIGYMQGECISLQPKLKWTHFKRVQVFNKTKHPKTKKERFTVLAWTKNEYDTPVLLICKQLNSK